MRVLGGISIDRYLAEYCDDTEFPSQLGICLRAVIQQHSKVVHHNGKADGSQYTVSQKRVPP